MSADYGHRIINAPGMPGDDEFPDESLPDNVALIDEIAPARDFLRARHRTTQAGFTSERIPKWLFKHRPILMDDGESHDEHRKQLARFFAPRVLEERHGTYMREVAARMVHEARQGGSVTVDELALLYSVEVTSRIVGLSEQSVAGLAERLTRFFRQPPVNHRLPDHGRSNRDWIEAAKKALGPVIEMYLKDVRPAIRSRKRNASDDIISHLLEAGYSSSEILMECITYGTAGMVTTREFICVSLWHLMGNDRLRGRYLVAEEAERISILSEIIRLEPPVGHIYRRVVDGETEGCPYANGTLVDVDVRTANIDPSVFGDDASELCPARDLRASERVGLSFGDGEHRCPGQPLALMETDILLLELLRQEPIITNHPEVSWDTLIEGYQLRGFTLTFSRATL